MNVSSTGVTLVLPTFRPFHAQGVSSSPPSRACRRPSRRLSPTRASTDATTPRTPSSQTRRRTETFPLSFSPFPLYRYPRVSMSSLRVGTQRVLPRFWVSLFNLLGCPKIHLCVPDPFFPNGRVGIQGDSSSKMVPRVRL